MAISENVDGGVTLEAVVVKKLTGPEAYLFFSLEARWGEPRSIEIIVDASLYGLIMLKVNKAHHL